MKNNFIIKSNFVYSKDYNNLNCFENSYLVCKDGNCNGIYKNKKAIPKEFLDFEVLDFSSYIVTPGFYDLHTHAPQNTFIGQHMDLELLDWLYKYTFVEEAKFKNIEHAKKAYKIFVNNLKYSATSAAVIFGTIHNESTLALCDELEKAKIFAYVGKVNMDRNSPKYLIEKTKDSIKNTIKFIDEVKKRNYKFVRPIITPRFLPSCTPKLLDELSLISKDNNLPIQSHLCENPSEVEWVKELEPESVSYGDAYHRHKLFGNYAKTIMAHVVYPNETDIGLLCNDRLFVAHCPSSNANLTSGIAPIRKFLDNNINVGLGTDVAAGSTLNMWNTIRETIQYSKIRARHVDSKLRSIKFKEAFYMATIGGGKFFGNFGSFDKGYKFNALVLDDSNLKNVNENKITLEERLERFTYLSESKNIIHKYNEGLLIF